MEKSTTSAGLFGQAIAMDVKEDKRNNGTILPPGHIIATIIGASGSGKSTLLLNILPQLAELSQVIICSLIPNNPVYSAIERWCGDMSARGSNSPKMAGKSIEFVVLNDPITAQMTIEEMVERKPEGTFGCIVFDDFSNGRKTTTDPYNVMMNQVSMMLRNLGYNSIYITQSATNIQTLTRNNANVRAVFMMNDVHAIRSIKNDFVASGLINGEQFDALYRKLNEKYHSFLLLVNKGGTDRHLYINIPGQTRGIEEVELSDQRLEDVLEDPFLCRMVSVVKNTAMSSFNKRRAREAIADFIERRSEELTMEPSQLTDAIAEKFDIDL